MRTLVAALSATLLLTGACSDAPPNPADDPKAALREAFERLGDDPLTISLSLDADAEALERAMAEEPDPAPAGLASTLVGSEVVISTNGATGEEAAAEMTVVVDGEPAAEIVAEGSDLFLRVDVAGLMGTFGADPAELDKALAKAPPGLDFLDAAVAGEWIHLTGAQQLAAMTGQPQEPTEEQQEQFERFLDTLVNDRVTARTGEEEGPGTHVEVNVPMRAVADDLLDFAKESAGGALPASQLAPLDTSEIPEGELVLDTWIDEGELTQLRFDFLNNAEAFGEDEPPEVDELALTVGFEDWDEEIETPDDAVEVSVQEIFGALMTAVMTPVPGEMPGMPGSGEMPAPGEMPGSDPSEVCREIAKLPVEQQQAFKQLCPNL